MNEDLNLIMNHFDDKGIPYQKLDSMSALRMIFPLRNGSFDSFLLVSQEPRSLELVSRLPVRVPEEKREPVAELLHRADQNARIGHLHLDMDQGEITSRTGIMLGPDSPLDDEMICHLIAANLILADNNLPAVQKVIFGDSSPKQALNLPDPDNESGGEKKTSPRLGGRLGKFFEGSEN